jgi:hypothetical protein
VGAVVALAVGLVVLLAFVARGGSDETSPTAAPNSAATTPAPGPTSSPLAKVPSKPLKVPITSVAALSAIPSSALTGARSVTLGSGSHYSLEKLTLQQPVGVTTSQGKGRTSTVYRLTISGGSFQPRSQPAIVYIDERPVGIATESTNNNELIVVFADRTVIKAGTELAFSYGGNATERVVVTNSMEVKQ